jgi:hypothetical protein
MARIRAAQPVKLIVGLLGGDVDLLRRARQLLVHEYGAVDLESDFWPFVETDYYRPEMGPGLQRWFLSFERLIRPEALAEIKRQTNEFEAKMAEECLSAERPRPVNLDPGYLNLFKLVLATTKDRDHRIYVGSGIYAEVTLHHRDGAWQTWPWTYPDYRKPEYLAWFERVRGVYRKQSEDMTRWTQPAAGGPG